MRKLLILIFAFAAAAAGQTQVHRPVPLPSWRDLKFPPLKPVVIPKPETFTLPNGMKVYLLENHELPLMSGVALVRTGNLFDPPDKVGVADLTGTLIRTGGTEKKTGDQLDVELENVAASVESGIGETSGSVSFSCLKDNADQVLGDFKDVLTSPAFREDKLDLAKTQLRSMIARRNDEAAGIANREFTNIVYGRNTPYGWMIEYATLDNIQRQDLVRFYQRYFFPSNILLAVYGDFSSAEMKAKLESLFGDWTVKQPPVPKFPAVEKKPQPGIYLATKTDVTQTYFNIGQLGGEFKDKDFPALAVMSDILGGGFSSRLFKKVRTELGYAYDIGASWSPKYDHPGLFEINGSTQSKDTVPTIEAIRGEVTKIRTSEVTDQELQTAKDTVLNGFVFYFDEPSKTLNRLLQYEYFGYPEDFIFTYQKAVGAVTKADVLRVAKEYLHPGQFTIVAVGNPKQFVTPLSTLGLKETALDLTIPEPKKAVVAANPASKQKGRELLERAQRALGGPDKLAAVKDLSMSAEVAISTGGPGMKVQQKSDFIFPSRMRQEIQAPFGKQVSYSDGESGWIATLQGVQVMPEPVLKQSQGEMFHELIRLVLSDEDPQRMVVATGPGVVESSNTGGEAASLKIDEKTGLPVAVSYETMGRTGPVQVEETFSDWREVNGIKLPFAMSITQAGKKFADAQVTDYRINSGLTEEALSKKP